MQRRGKEQCLKAPALAHCLVGARPGARAAAGPWEASAWRQCGLCHLQAEWVSFFISAHGNGMVNLYDIVVTTQSCEDDGCHKSHYRAVCQR